MKATSLAIFSLLSVISVVIAQEKTLRVNNASFRATPETLETPTTSNPEVQFAVLDCTIEEDNISFTLEYGAEELQLLLTDTEVISFTRRRKSFAVTRQTDQVPLPRAIDNPDPDSRRETNEMYEVLIANGQDIGDVVPDDFVLDRPFILNVSYRDGRNIYVGNIEIPPEALDGLEFFFTIREKNMRFPLRYLPPRAGE